MSEAGFLPWTLDSHHLLLCAILPEVKAKSWQTQRLHLQCIRPELSCIIFKVYLWNPLTLPHPLQHSVSSLFKPIASTSFLLLPLYARENVPTDTSAFSFYLHDCEYAASVLWESVSSVVKRVKQFLVVMKGKWDNTWTRVSHIHQELEL